MVVILDQPDPRPFKVAVKPGSEDYTVLNGLWNQLELDNWIKVEKWLCTQNVTTAAAYLESAYHLVLEFETEHDYVEFVLRWL